MAMGAYTRTYITHPCACTHAYTHTQRCIHIRMKAILWLASSDLVSTTFKVAIFQKFIYVTEFAKRGLIHAIINIEKSRFKILNTVYLENAWCLVYEILHQSIVIQGNLVGVLFDGLLAELPAILDGFFHQYHK